MLFEQNVFILLLKYMASQASDHLITYLLNILCCTGIVLDPMRDANYPAQCFQYLSCFLFSTGSNYEIRWKRSVSWTGEVFPHVKTGSDSILAEPRGTGWNLDMNDHGLPEREWIWHGLDKQHERESSEKDRRRWCQMRKARLLHARPKWFNRQ